MRPKVFGPALICILLPSATALGAGSKSSPQPAAEVSRQETWKGLEYWLRTSGQGFAAPLENMQTEGFKPVYRSDLLLGLRTEKAGASCTYVSDRDGAYYPAVQISAMPQAVELKLSRDSREVARFTAGDSDRKSALYCLPHPMDVRRGQRLTLTTSGRFESCRIEGLFFGKEPIRLPRVKIENLQVWSIRPGEAEICWTTNCPAESGTVEYRCEGRVARSVPPTYLGKNHRCVLEGLDPRKTYQAKVLCRHDGHETASDTVSFRAAPPTPPPTRRQAIELSIPEPTACARRDWPATIGLPFARAALAEVSDLHLADAAGRQIEAQFCPLSRWPDGSVAWVLLDFLAATQSGSHPASYLLRCQSGGIVPAASRVLADLRQTGSGWTLRSPQQAITLGTTPGALLVMRRGPTETPITLEMTTGDGAVWRCGRPDPTSVALELNGPVRAVVKFSGPLLTSSGTKGWRYLARLSVYRRQSALGLDISFYWDRAKPRMKQVRSWLLRLPVGGRRVRAAVGTGPLEALRPGEEIRLLQDRDDHYTLRTPSSTRDGVQATGLARAAGPGRQWTVVMPQFWQTYPAGFTIRRESLEVDLLPPLPPDTYSDPASRESYYRLYAWFHQGNYQLRGGQVVRRRMFLVPEALSDQQATRQAAWWSAPLLPQGKPEYLCGTGILGRPLYVPRAGVWDEYERMFARGFAGLLADRQRNRLFGWMHFGDWYGERGLNFGNNEYDLAWALAVQWMRTGRRDYFDRGLELARHYSAVDTRHGEFSRGFNGLVWEHSFNHVGTFLTTEQLHLPLHDPKVHRYLTSDGLSMFHGSVDPQGHIFQEGNWICAAISGDRFLWDVAHRVADNQAYWLTKDFDFGIERAGGWPLINAVAAYRHTGNPYYLNAARLMIQRCLERQDPVRGGWLNYPPKGETEGVTVRGGKPFATGILSYGILRYLDVEPRSRPEVRQMLVRAADWLMRDAWVPGRGFSYISKCPKYQATAGSGPACLLDAELVAFAYQQTREKKYLDFWREMVGSMLTRRLPDSPKYLAECVHQTIFGLERIRPWLTSLGGNPASQSP